jgi:hypothetical protein
VDRLQREKWCERSPTQQRSGPNAQQSNSQWGVQPTARHLVDPAFERIVPKKRRCVEPAVQQPEARPGERIGERLPDEDLQSAVEPLVAERCLQPITQLLQQRLESPAEQLVAKRCLQPVAKRLLRQHLEPAAEQLVPTQRVEPWREQERRLPRCGVPVGLLPLGLRRPILGGPVEGRIPEKVS